MKTEFVKENGKLTVSVFGKVDTTTAPELEKAVFDRLDGVTELVLDLKSSTVFYPKVSLRIFWLGISTFLDIS